MRQEEALAGKVVRGTFWVTVSYTFTSALHFLRTVVLIRFLNPADFGLMGIGRVAIDMLNRFSEPGIESGLVQRREVNESVLNTAWVIMAIRGIILFCLLYILSPAISRFYNNENINPILRVISFSFLFTGITSAGVYLFVKELNFKKKVIFEQANAISTTVVSVVLAVILRNVWALVIGYITGATVGFFFSYGLHPFRPSLKFDLNIAKELLNFGKYLFGSCIVLFVVMQGPNALVGKVLGLNLLGFYVVAFNIANIPTTSVTHLVSQIAFPAYARLQDDLVKLRDGYLKVTRLVAFLSIPIAGGIFMLIPEFVQIFLGIRWMPIVLPVRILSIFGLFRSIASTAGPVFYGVGRPDIEFKCHCLNLGLLAILIYPFTVKMGLAGTSIALSSLSVVYTYFIIRLYKLIRLDVEKVQFLKILFFPSAAAFLMCLLIFLIRRVSPFNLIIRFSLSILAGAGLYVAILYLLDRYLGYGLVETVRFAVTSYKGEKSYG